MFAKCIIIVLCIIKWERLYTTFYLLQLINKMFIISQVVLRQLGICNVSSLPSYSIALGLVVYASLYLYLLFYNNDYIYVFNKFIIYIVGVDLLLSSFVYFKNQPGIDYNDKVDFSSNILNNPNVHLLQPNKKHKDYIDNDTDDTNSSLSDEIDDEVDEIGQDDEVGQVVGMCPVNEFGPIDEIGQNDEVDPVDEIGHDDEVGPVDEIGQVVEVGPIEYVHAATSNIETVDVNDKIDQNDTESVNETDNGVTTQTVDEMGSVQNVASEDLSQKKKRGRPPKSVNL